MPDPLGSLAFTWPFLALFLASFLLGAVPFGVVLTRLAGLGDIRKIGSGNIGATNVLRTGHKGLAATTLVLDAAKGAAPVWLAGIYLTQDFAVAAGAGALLGHMFPLWLRLGSARTAVGALAVVADLVVLAGLLLIGKGSVTVIALILFLSAPLIAWGGKGVATGLGILLALNWEIGILACVVWLVVAAVFRFSSLAAMAAFLAAAVAALVLANNPIADEYWSDPQRVEFFVFVAVAIWLRHLANIGRLLRAREPRIGRSAPSGELGAPQ